MVDIKRNGSTLIINHLPFKEYHVVGEYRTSWDRISSKLNQLRYYILVGISRTLYPYVLLLGVRVNTKTRIIGT